MISLFKRLNKTREEAIQAEQNAEEKGAVLRQAISANKEAVDRVLLSYSNIGRPVQKLHRA